MKTLLLNLVLMFLSAGVLAGDAFDLRVSGAAPWQDDAALRSVEFLGTKTGWAVGDHGTAWRTEDGGTTWSLIQVPSGASFRSVCFLTQRSGPNVAGTSRVIWLAGQMTQPFTRAGTGVILKSEDGGQSWQTPDEGTKLPPLSYIRFFGPQEGIAVGESTAECPTGVVLSNDGGLTWRPADGFRTEGWCAAAFSEFNDGVVAGPHGQVALVAGTSVAPPRRDAASRRTIRSVSLVDGLSGFAAGDGGLVLRTTNGGVSWDPLLNAFPPGLSVFADFEAVATFGEHVWIAGRPGGVIWHSADSGSTWQQQLTGESIPIHALHFSNADQGCAVGALGLILKTTDGGQTWRAIRGGSRRAALLSIHAGPDRVPFGMLAKYAGDQGYRTATMVLPHHESGRETRLRDERCLSESVISSGGSSGQAGWRLAIGLPEISSDLQALTSEWQKQTEGRLAEVLVSHLVATLRTWRPSVVVIDEPQEHDAAALLIRDALKRAVTEAGDSTRFIEHQQLAGVNAWKVEQIFQRVSAETRAGVSIAPYEVLPHLGTTVETIAAAGRSKLVPAMDHRPQPEPFVPLSDEASTDRFQLVSVRDLWSGISIAPGSEARRPSLPIQEQQLAIQQELAVRQRNFRGIVGHTIVDPARGAALIGEVRNVTKHLPRPQAALQLAHLANDYRQARQWEQAEAAFIELINEYAEQPASAEAMLWLLHYWSSDEMAWIRSRGIGLTAREQRVDSRGIANRLQKLLEDGAPGLNDPARAVRELNDPLQQLELLNDLPQQNSRDWQQAARQNWQRQALQMAKLFQRRLPEAYQTPEVYWPVVSVLRRQQQHALADALLRQRLTVDLLEPVAQKAANELWVTQPVAELPPHLGNCGRTATRPVLDGVLGDSCWQTAKEFRLTGPGEDTLSKEYPFALLSCDDEFLYLAASLPRATGAKTDGPQYDGRQHDDNLAGFDRLSLYLDVDRDYATAFEIHVDQRGRVAEACWEDTGWNPKMFVAVDADQSHWRLELAIPFNELTGSTPRRGDHWALALIRTMPHTGWQSWVGTGGDETPHADQFGLLQFR